MHKPQYNNIVQKATEFLNSSRPGSEKNEVSDKLNDIRMRWEELNRKTNERQTQLEDMLPLSQKYHEHAQNVKDVVTLAETELGTCTDVSPDVEIAKQELQNIKVSKPYEADFVVLRAVLCCFTQCAYMKKAGIFKITRKKNCFTRKSTLSITLKFNRLIMFIFVVGSLEGFGKTNS